TAQTPPRYAGGRATRADRRRRLRADRDEQKPTLRGVGRVLKVVAQGAPQFPNPRREPVDGYTLGPLVDCPVEDALVVSGQRQRSARTDRSERVDDAARRLQMPDLVQQRFSGFPRELDRRTRRDD